MRATTGRLSQDQRRERTRGALLEAAARRVSHYGYANLNLEAVARDAGYTRGAIYHLFPGKEALALAVVEWVQATWYEAMGPLLSDGDAATVLLRVAKAHAVYCRRDIARVMAALRVEMGNDASPLSEATGRATGRVVTDVARLIDSGRTDGSIPPGTDPHTLALAVVGALEGLVISLAGREPEDELLAERTMAGLLCLPSEPPPVDVDGAAAG